mgnify:CR=1 FL=1
MRGSHQLISGSSDPACHNAVYMGHHNTEYGTNLSDGSFAKRTLSHTSNPPTGIRPVGTQSGSTVPFDDGALRDQPGFQMTPQRDCQFARQSNDHDASDAPLLTLGAVLEPLAQCAIRLMPEPKPCGFDHSHPSQPIARLGDALAAMTVTAVISTGRNPDIAGHLPSIIELPVIDFPRERRR